jgi:hypothetical protein
VDTKHSKLPMLFRFVIAGVLDVEQERQFAVQERWCTGKAAIDPVVGLDRCTLSLVLKLE